MAEVKDKTITLEGLKSVIDNLGIPKSPFGGATSDAAGSIGLVPAPSAGDQDKFLKADGTWTLPDGGAPLASYTMASNIIGF